MCLHLPLAGAALSPVARQVQAPSGTCVAQLQGPQIGSMRLNGPQQTLPGRGRARISTVGLGFCRAHLHGPLPSTHEGPKAGAWVTLQPLQALAIRPSTPAAGWVRGSCSPFLSKGLPRGVGRWRGATQILFPARRERAVLTLTLHAWGRVTEGRKGLPVPRAEVALQLIPSPRGWGTSLRVQRVQLRASAH